MIAFVRDCKHEKGPLIVLFNHFLNSRAEFCLIFSSFFGQWSFKKKCFWDLLTFKQETISSTGYFFFRSCLFRFCVKCLWEKDTIWAKITCKKKRRKQYWIGFVPLLETALEKVDKHVYLLLNLGEKTSLDNSTNCRVN